MARRIAMAMVLTTAGCAPATAQRTGPAPTTTVAPPDPHPPSTTSKVPPSVADSGTATSAPPVAPGRTVAPPSDPPPAGHGLASWYARGTVTASGAPFDARAITAAHRTLAFGTRVRVCHGGRCVVVVITDRGPAESAGRVLDLSRAAFLAIADLGAGVVEVSWEVVG